MGNKNDGIKRRPSASEGFKLDLEASNIAAQDNVKEPETVSTTGVDWKLHTIPGSEPNTPGYELSKHIVGAAPSEKFTPAHRQSNEKHSAAENWDNSYNNNAASSSAGIEPTGYFDSAFSKGKTDGGRLHPDSNVSIEEHELVFTPNGYGENLVTVKARETTRREERFAEELDTEEYQRLYDSSRLNWRDPPMNKFRIIACCVWTFTSGMSDAAPGALLPKMEEHYGISYSIVSMIWMSCAVGYIIIALTSELLVKVIPKNLLKTLGVGFQIVTYALISANTSFPVVCVAFFFNGMGLALGLTQFNVFLSSFSNASTCLAFMHGFYGVGALVAPLIAQSMLNQGFKWSQYYFILLGLTIFNFFNIFWSYKNTSKDLAEFEKADAHRMEMEQLQAQQAKGASYKQTSPFLDSIRDYRTWLICAFVFFYQGGEVSLGGWMVTFLLEERHGNVNSTGYIAAGYWGGLTLGRFCLTTLLYKKLGGRRSIVLLTLNISILLLLAWLVPNFYVSAVCTTFSGLFIGPIYPLMIALVSHPKILPSKILNQSLLIMTSIGSSGGAVVPLIVGLISDRTGTWVLFPIVFGLFLLMILSWLLLPNVENSVGKSFWRKYIW
ncbi:unnamed protein product [Kluyveromyces dobzhanskii CBS 2104]|uniref:WGS project CCBQ000000000 data, contig 00041 n=1 Tax=Kluyveromyces dobzhanskii CBS 2104 TaxID=1427455 RepID=A0A0A8L285_9SACH|nr:unnamed protein product [Kluyveromyces dobzhanskii CBS 2104]